MDVILNGLWQGVVVALAAAARLRVVPRPHTLARDGLLWRRGAAVPVLPAISPLRAVSTSIGDGTPSPV